MAYSAVAWSDGDGEAAPVGASAAAGRPRPRPWNAWGTSRRSAVLLVREAVEEERYGAPRDSEAEGEAGDPGLEARSRGADVAPGDGADRPDAEPDPADDADALEDLGDEIATLAAHIHAATERLLALIAEFDRRRGWELEGHSSCAHWLAYRTGIDLGAAREKVRTARSLVELPRAREAMGRGELSFSQVRALTRVATPENETELVALARGCTTAQLERMVRGWKRGSSKDEAALERERHRGRTLSVFPDLDGMYVVRGRLTPELGVLLQRAIEAASDALYREEREHVAEREEERRRAAARRRADALGLLAARAMAAGLGGRCAEREEERTAERRQEDSADTEEACRGGKRREGEARESEARAGEAREDDRSPAPASRTSGTRVLRFDSWPPAAEVDGPNHLHSLPCTCDVPISGTRAQRYQVVLHVDEHTLRGEDETTLRDDETTPKSGDEVGRAAPSRAVGEAARSQAFALGRSDFEDGTRVSAETSRRLSCDAGLVRITHRADGSILDVGRKTRTISPALRRALEARDRGCRFPGCGLRFTDGHHIRHWTNGGPTSLANCLLLCHFHHTLVHEGGWEVGWWGAGRAVFFDPRGGTHFDGRWEPPELPANPVRALVEQNRAAGARPDGSTAGARWKREADIPDDVYFAAMEGVE